MTRIYTPANKNLPLHLQIGVGVEVLQLIIFRLVSCVSGGRRCGIVWYCVLIVCSMYLMVCHKKRKCNVSGPVASSGHMFILNALHHYFKSNNSYILTRMTSSYQSVSIEVLL